MKTYGQHNYEKAMMNLDEVLDLINEATQNKKPLSLSRFGHLEVAYLGWEYFPDWTNSFEPYSLYSGATVSLAKLRDDLNESLRTSDLIGLHASWGARWEDRETAKLTTELFKHINFSPKRVCSAFITHELVKSDRFWSTLKGRKVALVGRRAAEAYPIFVSKGVNVTFTSGLEGCQDIDRVYQDLCNHQEWDIAFVAAGVPAKILAPRLANYKSKVVIDFGHALDLLIEGENFNYEKILQDWKDKIDMDIKVSIVMAVYNGEMFLKEALDSVFSQTYPNVEIIIVNDGSTDSTKAILDEINDERVKVLHLERNQGAANALNMAIRQAKGQWIAIHDADDNSYPTKIAEQVKYLLQHPHLVGIGTLAEAIPGSSDISADLLKHVADGKNYDIARADIRKKSYWGCPLFHSSVIFSKDVFWEVGGYNPEFKIAYDYDLWLRLLEKGELEKVPKVLLQYRVYRWSLSNKDGMATLYEIQIASSKAIHRLFSSDKQEKPKVIVIGPKKACKHYQRHVSPSSGLEVYSLIFEDMKKQVPRAVRNLKAGKVQGILVLDMNKKGRILDELVRQGLRLNEQVFNIYNFIE